MASNKTLWPESCRQNMDQEQPPKQLLSAPVSASHRERFRPVAIFFQLIIAFAIVATSGFVMQRMVADKKKPPQRPVREQAYTIETIQAHWGSYQPKITAYGEIVAGNVIEVRAELSGILKSLSPQLRAGHIISANTQLAEIDPFDFETALAEIEADIRESQARIKEANAQIAAARTEQTNIAAQLELAKKDLERAQALIKKGSVTRQTVDQRQQVLLQKNSALQSSGSHILIEIAKMEQQQAALDRLQLRKTKALRDIKRTVVISRFDAIVESESLTQGQLVSANQIVAKLLEISALEVEFTLSDQQFGRLVGSGSQLQGKPVDVLWETGQRSLALKGRITRTAPTISADMGGVSIYAALDGLTKETVLRPGAFVQVQLGDITYDKVFKIPESALYDEKRIYLVKDGRLQSVMVDVAAFDAGSVLVSGPVEEGVEILTTRIAEAGEGLKVQLVGQESAETPKQGSFRKRGKGASGPNDADKPQKGGRPQKADEESQP